MGRDYALSTELGATVAAPIAGSPLEYAFDHPRQRLDPMSRPCAARADRPPAWAVPFLAVRGPAPQIRSALCRDGRTELNSI
jgi:hypothetical protein